MAKVGTLIGEDRYGFAGEKWYTLFYCLQEDLKQIFSFLLWEELQSYDSELPLLQLIKYKVQAAWHEYVRVNCGNLQVDNRHQYLLLKKIAYLYFQKKDNNSLSEIIDEISAELNLTEESVEKYLVAVSTFKLKWSPCQDHDLRKMREHWRRQF